ncbi:hypothetical protein HPB51_019469 [Rhipicephalus microplus]|uniref:Transposable element P transposase-like GTP-binding insertion domain-containing protein n=1 Tax=Rhipicephalus microplus TaxID=6941 RepID=A0A9J6DBH0_RHIMP|nr:hypothetical protein HPB51_019469 [Rhipicephalus microplus]
MAGGNQSVWKLFGIVVGKHSKPKVSCARPCDPSRKLFFMPNVPHLLKNLRNHLTQGQEITLTEDLAKKLKLPGRTVSVQPIKRVVEVDAKADLKLAPHLKEACVQPGHFEKMKVGFAFSLFNNDTAAALRMLVEAKDDEINKTDALTTAWFVETVFKWFKLMSSRTTKLAISHFDEQRYKETVTFLKGMIDLFEKIEIGTDAKKCWKPIQTGIVMATTTMLHVQELFLNDLGFVYLLLSRFSTDALENLFSTLRAKNPVPGGLEFRSALKIATLSLFLRPSKDGSYSDADGFMLAGINSGKHQHDGVDSVHTPDNMLDLEILEQESLTYLAGYVVRGVKNGLACQECQAALSDSSNACRLQQLKSFTKHKMTLAIPSAAVLQVEFAEAYVRKNEVDLLTNKVSVPALQEKIIASLFTANSFPPCHELPKKTVQLFLRTRMYILVKKSNAEAERKRLASKKSGSRSVSMRDAVKNVH